ncbi:hypothetical protein PC128_g23349 [Phytophthora cactorum]|nr:hypothetical protein PC120_g24087 [Phytophthora cactorum]KAG3045174.1 hypothetical protein PC121_g21449 [Phytophthora cactorum]KAG3149790.1 hypothetical protein PC128_g23349 [Phytophthora cactorum]KAG4040120.1 hypothetical protein PC123_g24336 [Phytophthora cactorum]
MMELAINNAVHASTGLTLFFVNFGRHPRVPALLGLERYLYLAIPMTTTRKDPRPLLKQQTEIP